MDLDSILKVAVRGGASDILLKVGSRPTFRFNGDLTPLRDGMALTQDVIAEWIDRILPGHLRKRLDSAGDADFSYQSHHKHRFRVNAFRQRQTYGMVLRVISNHIRTLEELQLPKVVASFADWQRGLVLFTGATGSGKSTSLASIIQKINSDQPRHIITIEDPIEFEFKDGRSTINQREVGIDTVSFSSALRAALRQDPDVILVGELRDKETTETALMAAETGHLVFSTLHTLDAVESLTRLLSYFDPHQQHSIRLMLSQTLKAVVSQRLVSRADGRGLVAALEIMIVNERIRDMILSGERFDGLHQAIKVSNDSYGMQSFDQSLMSLFESGVISREEALQQASNRDDMELALTGVDR